MKDKLPVLYRSMQAEDIPFILDSWTRSLWPVYQHIPKFREYQHKRIEAILSNAHTLICCDKEDTSVIFAYVVWEEDLLHWVYVKYPVRRLGVSKQMLARVPDSAKLFHSHETLSGVKAILRKSNSKLNNFVMERY